MMCCIDCRNVFNENACRHGIGCKHACHTKVPYKASSAQTETLESLKSDPVKHPEINTHRIAMWFGRYKGVKVADLPLEYCQAMLKQGVRNPLLKKLLENRVAQNESSSQRERTGK